MKGKCSLIRKDFLEVILITKEQGFGTMRLFQKLEFPIRNEKKAPQARRVEHPGQHRE